MTSLTHKTATIAFRMRSWSERCSMNTSAYGTVRRHSTKRSGTETDLVNQDDRLPRRGDVEGALEGLIDLRCSNAQVTSPDHV